MIDYIYKNVFNDQIWTFYDNDMKACFRAAKNAQNGGQLGGQNFTAALLILSIIDFCTGYFKGRTINTKKDGRTSIDCVSASDVAEFMKKYFINYPMFGGLKFGEKFYQVFRHG